MPREVAILCAARNSVYKQLPGCVVFDEVRDARTFGGGCPVIAHPPCRGWSKFTRHQAKPVPGEMDLGLFCADKLRACGGVLEQPAHSLLWESAKLPYPGRGARGDLWSMAVWQCWWGYPLRKATWLCFSGVAPGEVSLPFSLHPQGLDRRREQLMSNHQRAATSEAFARWLISVARDAQSGGLN